MIAQSISQQIMNALKAKDEVRLSTLRMLSSALNYEKIAKQRELSTEEELGVVRKEAKKRTEAIEALRQAQDKSSSSDSVTLEKRLEQERNELEILKAYLPAEMDESELLTLVDQVIKDVGAKEVKDMGRVIGEVMMKAQGKADGRRVSLMVKEKLTA